jgi:hypothetical protein
MTYELVNWETQQSTQSSPLIDFQLYSPSLYANVHPEKLGGRNLEKLSEWAIKRSLSKDFASYRRQTDIKRRPKSENGAVPKNGEAPKYGETVRAIDRHQSQSYTHARVRQGQTVRADCAEWVRIAWGLRVNLYCIITFHPSLISTAQNSSWMFLQVLPSKCQLIGSHSLSVS